METSLGSIDDFIHISVDGPEAWVSLHPGQFLEAIQSAPLDEIEMKIWTEYRPVLLTCGDWTVVQTPMADQETAEKYQEYRREELTKEEEDDF